MSSAADLARDAAKALGGGTAKHADVVQGGGPERRRASTTRSRCSRLGGARRRQREPAAVSAVLGVDLGERRIGLAVTDPSGVLASPHDTLERAVGRVDDDHRAIVAAAADVGATRIVVGLPRSLSGKLGPAARSVLDEVDGASAEVARAVGHRGRHLR